MAASIHRSRCSGRTLKIDTAIGASVLGHFGKEEQQWQGFVSEWPVIREEFVLQSPRAAKLGAEISYSWES
jgi:hypothetical protein